MLTLYNDFFCGQMECISRLKKLVSLAVILRPAPSVCVEISLPDKRVVPAMCWCWYSGLLRD
jgi:hypothetical protein